MPHAEPRWSSREVDRIVEGAECVVLDFYRTLSSEYFFLPLGEAVLKRIQALLWGHDQTLVNRWLLGETSAPQIADYLAGHLGIPAAEIETALRDGCRRLALNDAVWQFARAARAAGKRTALVTINMDVFSQDVVPGLGLEGVFESIVNSADHGQVDKRRLWPVAFEQLGGGIGYADSLLIDDSADCAATFVEAGGKAHRYRDDADFVAWLDGRRA